MKIGTSSGGVGILTVLCIVFVILKLCGVIAWSWWLVLLPLWVEIGISVIVLFIIATLKRKEYKRLQEIKNKYRNHNGII